MDATERYRRSEAAHGRPQEQRPREILLAVELAEPRVSRVRYAGPNEAVIPADGHHGQQILWSVVQLVTGEERHVCLWWTAVPGHHHVRHSSPSTPEHGSAKSADNE